jgi:hypothetical protein
MLDMRNGSGNNADGNHNNNNIGSRTDSDTRDRFLSSSEIEI